MWCKSLTLEKYISFRMKWFFSPPFLSVSPFLHLNLARRQSYAYAVGLYTRPEIKSWPDVKFCAHAQCILPRCLEEEPLRLRSEVLRSFIARHCFPLWVEIAKYSFKGNVISSRWPTFSFRHFEHLARLLKGDQAFLCKVTNKEGILYFAWFHAFNSSFYSTDFVCLIRKVKVWWKYNLRDQTPLSALSFLIK